MASIGGNELVIGSDCRLDANGDCFLANCEMAKATNELCLIKGVGRHLHPSHGGHVSVHVDEHFFGYFDLKRRCFTAVGNKGFLVKREREWLRLAVGSLSLYRGGIGGRLQCASRELDIP